jgi:hypothetical protein
VNRRSAARTLLATSLAATLVVAGACRRAPNAGNGPYAAMVAEAVPNIERTVGLKFKRPPVIETRDKAQVRAYVLQQFEDSAAQRDLAGSEAAYKLLGMIPDSLDLRKLETDLLVEQIVGYYDPKTKVLYIVNGVDKDAAQTVVTHELVHALQDQYVNLDSIQTATGDDDRTLASQAVFEGQAVFEQLEAMLPPGNVAVAMPGGWDRVREEIRNNQSSMPVFSRAPLVIQETLLFPYLSGAEFIRNYKEREHGGVPYTDLRNMPTSTEQILHLYSYFGTPDAPGKRDEPTPVSIALPAGAKPTFQNDLGEFETRLFLYQQLTNQDDAVRGAAGWDGDRYVIWQTPHGPAIAWASVWDTPSDAEDFYSLLQRVRDGGKRPARSVQVTTRVDTGRPVVLWVDVPAGERADMVTTANVTLGAER